MKMRHRLTLIIALLYGLAVLAESAYADLPSNVELIRFELFSLNNSVRIEWETATELDTVAYKILRSSNGDFIELDGIGIVPSEGGPAIGANYSVIDQTAVNGQTYVYKLIEIEADLSETEVASGVVMAGILPTNTPTPIQISGTTPTPTPAPGQPANTPTLTPTPSRTGTAVPTTTASPTATPTGRPTQTLTATPSTTPTPTRAAILVTSTPFTAVNPPTATPGNVMDNSENVVFAQAPETPEGGYPAPEAPPTRDGNSYPGGVPPTAPANTAPPTPYPAKPGNPPETEVPVIGSQDANPGTSGQNAPSGAENEVQNSGLGFLWAGFIVALLIFITGVVGSIFYFSRKQEP